MINQEGSYTELNMKNFGIRNPRKFFCIKYVYNLEYSMGTSIRVVNFAS
jgi:hypothetical protein